MAFEPEKLTGLSGFLAGPYGGLATQFGGGLLKGIGGLISGRGRRRRRGELEEFTNSLEGREITDADVREAVRSRQGEVSQAVNPVAREVSSRVGLDSGLAGGFIINAMLDKQGSIRGEERDRQFTFNQNLLGMMGRLKSMLAQL